MPVRVTRVFRKKWVPVLRLEYAQFKESEHFLARKCSGINPVWPCEYQGCATDYFTEENDVGTSN